MVTNKNEIFLAIDTSTERGLVALFNQSHLIGQKELPFGYQSSHSLVPYLVDLLKWHEMTPQDLRYVAVGVGPGSYTGIRVGVMVAKTLAYSCRIPLIGFCSLSGFIPEEEGEFAAIVDAKIGGVYLLKGKKESSATRFLSPEVCALENLENSLANTRFLVSPNLKIIQPKIEQLYPQKSWKWIEKAPDAEIIGVTAREKYTNDEFTLSGHLNLLYLRKTQAEIERNK